MKPSAVVATILMFLTAACFTEPWAPPTLVETTAASGEPVKYLDTQGRRVYFLAHSPDGSELAVVLANGAVVLDTTTWKVRRRLPDLRMVAYSPDSDIMATAEGTDGLQLWKRGEAQPFHTLVGKKSLVVYAAFSPDGELLASAHPVGGVKLWDVRTGALVRTLHAKSLTSLVFSGDGKRLYACGSDRRITVWNTTTWEITKSTQLPETVGAVRTMSLSPDGTTLATGHRVRNRGTTMIWNTESWRATVLSGNFVTAFSPDGKVLSVASDDIKLWDTALGKGEKDMTQAQLPQLAGAGAFYALSYSPDGKWLAAGRWNGAIMLLDTGTLTSTDPS